MRQYIALIHKDADSDYGVSFPDFPGVVTAGRTLDEVRALLALSANDRQDTCAQVRELAAGHLAEVRAKIADLRAMERVLADAVRRCTAGELPGCPIIDALSAA